MQLLIEIRGETVKTNASLPSGAFAVTHLCTDQVLERDAEGDLYICSRYPDVSEHVALASTWESARGLTTGMLEESDASGLFGLIYRCFRTPVEEGGSDLAIATDGALSVQTDGSETWLSGDTWFPQSNRPTDFDALVSKAHDIVRVAYESQVDRAGSEHIGHPLRVADKAFAISPLHLCGHARVAALLHDVIEDTDVTLQELEAAGFPPTVVNAVDLLTRRPEISALDYYESIRKDPVARLVKIADILDSTDTDRLKLLDALTRSRLKTKYAGAWSTVWGPTDSPN